MSVNGAITTLTNAPGTGGTTFTLATGTGAWFAAGPAIVYNASTTVPDKASIEAVTLGAPSGDSVTVTRAQQGHAALNLTAGAVLVQAITAKDWDDLVALVATKLAASARGAANGVASLDSGSKVPLAQLPDLSGTYAPIGGRSFKGFKNLIQNGYTASMGVVGDSTGAGATRWVALFAAQLAAKYPSCTVQYRDFTTGTTTYDTAPTVVQTGTAGTRYVTFDGTTLTGLSFPATTPNRITGNLDIRAKIRPTSWAPGTGNTKTIAAEWGVGSTRGWLYQLQNNGIPMLQWTTDGTTIVGPWPATVAVPFADGTDGWVRVVLNTNNAGNYQVTHYTSTDGVNWTILGAARNGVGTTSIVSLASQQLEIGSRGNGGAEPFGGRIYTVEIRNGIGGDIVAPVWPDQWDPVNSNWNATYTGAPIIDIWNGSWSGAAFTGQLIPNIAQLNPAVGMTAVVVNDSKNEGGLGVFGFDALYDSLLSTVQTRNPAAGILVTQQCQSVSPVAQYLIDSHAKRVIGLDAYARRRSYDPIPVYAAFAASSLGFGSLIAADGIHPTDATGSPLWMQTVLGLYNAA